MGKRTGLELRFPVGGLNRRYAYRQQPPFTTPDALNVRPDGTIEGRERGGSRPGIGKAYAEQIGGDEYPIRMLNSVTVVSSTGTVEWAATGGPAVLRIYDPQGRLVLTRDLERMGEGQHRLPWGDVVGSRRLAPGVYFLELGGTGGGSSATRAILMR